MVFGNSRKSKITGVDIDNASFKLIDVLLIDGSEYNVISNSQSCNKDIYVLFEPTVCSIINCEIESNIFKVNRHANIYSLKFNDIHSNGVKCLGAAGEDANL